MVDALTRQAAEAYTIHEFSERAVAQQRVVVDALLQNLGQASSGQIEKVLAQREQTAPERGLSPKIIKRVRRCLLGSHRSAAERRGSLDKYQCCACGRYSVRILLELMGTGFATARDGERWALQKPW